MQTYILKRILLSIPMLVGIMFISFFVMQMAPGTPGGGTLAQDGARSRNITKEQRDVMNRTFHLDKPFVDRFLYWLGAKQQEIPGERETAEKKAVRREQRKRASEKYAKLVAEAEAKNASAPLPAVAKLSPEELAAAKEVALSRKISPPRHGVLFGDFGYSMETHSVRVVDRIADALPVTLMFNILSLILMYLFAIPIGIYSATHPNTRADRTLTVGLFMMHSLPSFWVAVMLMKLVVSMPESLQLPIQGVQPQNAHEMTTFEWLWGSSKHLVLPLIAMTYSSFAMMSRFMRSSMLDNVRSDYIRTARAKGLRERYVIYKHALRNSLIPIITLLGSELPALIGGSVIIESIFGVPGMGYVGYKALLARDYTLLMATLMMTSVLVMVGFILSDILYKLADPRISFERLLMNTIHVNASTQILELRDGAAVLFRAPVSTAKNGLGETPGSEKTPRGPHRIAEKIGAGAPLFTVFESRQPVGIWDRRQSERDLILTRILWLEGLTPANASSKSRYIYIHGTNAEPALGTPASHGCIRLNNADIITLFDRVEVGTPVFIE